MLSSTTSSSSVSCSPDWIVYRNSRTLGARRNREADTQQQCLDACAGDSSCVSAQWFDRWTSDKCWLNDRRRPIHSSDDYTGRLKTRDWKTRDHQKCRGGKRRTGKHGTIIPGVENATSSYVSRDVRSQLAVQRCLLTNRCHPQLR